MSWESVKLSDIKEESSELPGGDYIFLIAPKSAGYRAVPWNQDHKQLNVRFIVAEGPLKGRVFFQQYNDPASFEEPEHLTKMIQGIKKLQGVLGVDPTDGEDTADYFNRVAQDHSPKFKATIKGASAYIDKKTKEEKMGRPKLMAFSVKPAV